MQKTMNNERKMFSNEDLEKLKNCLPGHYYRHFKTMWGKTFKAERVPPRQTVYAVITGVCENDKILDVLIEVVNQRNALRSKLLQATDYAKELKVAESN